MTDEYRIEYTMAWGDGCYAAAIYGDGHGPNELREMAQEFADESGQPAKIVRVADGFVAEVLKPAV